MKKLLISILLSILISTQLIAQQRILSVYDVVVNPIAINTAFNDVGPTLIDNNLFYSSITSKFGSNKRQNQFFTVFSIPMDSVEIPGQIGIKHNELNTEYHNGPLTYCELTNELFITRSNFDNAKTTNGIVDVKQVTLGVLIYQKVNEHWFYKEDFPFNSPDHSLAQPTINKTGDTLIFVSDRYDAYGKTDLYFSVKENGEWQTPQNMGSKINTKKSENTPFLNKDGNLFFASDGHGGVGGLDVFVTNLNEYKTKQIQNIGNTINSDADEFGLYIHPSQLIGFFASNRKGGVGKDDIYCIKTANYEAGLEKTQRIKEAIKALNANVNLQLKEYEALKKEEKQIASNVSFSAELEIDDQQIVPDFKFNFNYRMIDDTLKLRQNIFGLYEYQLSESYVLTALLETTKSCIDSKFEPYIKKGKHISIKINGNPDALNLSGDIYYKGEFGDIIEEQYTKEDSLYTLKIEKDQLLSKDEFSFLRAYAVKEYISSQIELLQNTQNTYNYVVIPKEKLSSKNKWVSIDFLIENAFDTFQ